MSQAPSAADPAAPEPFYRRFSYAFIWFAIAALLFKWFAIDAEEFSQRTMNWPAHQAKSEKAEVIWGGQESGHELILTFTTEIEGRIYRHQRVRQSGRHGSLTKLAETTYAPGQRFEVRVNPDNPGEVAFPTKPGRSRILGYIGSGLFVLLGLSVLFGKRSASRRKETAAS